MELEDVPVFEDVTEFRRRAALISRRAVAEAAAAAVAFSSVFLLPWRSLS